MTDSQPTTSTRPYLIRALHEWCSDNGFTPYIAVRVDETVQVPREFVKNGEIVLNVSVDATSALQLGNDFIEFKARFGGVARDVFVPVSRVMAVYARENGQGMAFPLEADGSSSPETVVQTSDSAVSSPSVTLVESVPPTEPPGRPGGGGRPALKRVK